MARALQDETQAFLFQVLELAPAQRHLGLGPAVQFVRYLDGRLRDRTRRTIFERLARGPRSVGELAKGPPVSRPAVSQHLKVLERAGLVVHEAVGTRRIYRVNADAVAGLEAYFRQFWTQALAGFKQVAERKEDR